MVQTEMLIGVIQSKSGGRLVSSVKVAYGQFEERKGYIFRPMAYLQWGTSEESLGAFLLLNPGKAKPLGDEVLQEGAAYFGETKVDQSMQQMQKLVERIYEEKELDGRVHIYNLFSLRKPENRDAIATFEKLARVGEVPVMDDYPPLEELKKHPWICKCWGINSKTNRNHLRQRKHTWIELLANANVPTFGKLLILMPVRLFPYPTTFAKGSRNIAG